MVGKGNRQEVIGVGKLGTRKRGVGGVVGTGPRREEGVGCVAGWMVGIGKSRVLVDKGEYV